MTEKALLPQGNRITCQVCWGQNGEHKDGCAAAACLASNQSTLRPQRACYPESLGGDMVFNQALVTWQYGEIERLETANGQLQAHGHEMWAEVKRLRAALTDARDCMLRCQKTGHEDQVCFDGDHWHEVMKRVDAALSAETIPPHGEKE